MRGRIAGLGGAAAAVTAATTIACLSAAGTASASTARPVAVERAHVAAASAAPAAVAAPAAYTPPKRNLKVGMTGADVKALQQRLAALKYYPGPIDSQFGSDTVEAVWAFQEVNHLGVDGVVGPATKAALVTPHAYKANDPKQAATRVEVNLKLGVLVFYKNRQISLVSHISSGGHYYYKCGSGSGTCFAKTPTGEFHALYFVKGWDKGPLGAMYNPVFFNYSGYAIHGETNDEVPIKNVSHGCVRIPYDIATWFHNQLTISQASGKGTQVWIYNQW